MPINVRAETPTPVPEKNRNLQNKTFSKLLSLSLSLMRKKRARLVVNSKTLATQLVFDGYLSEKECQNKLMPSL